MHYDIFNGDADGIFALHQYRQHNPVVNTKRITGVKRDISLLKKVENVKNVTLTVFDISLDSNRAPLTTILAGGNRVDYFDHHFAGDIPDSPGLHTTINPSAETCTSIIVNNALQGKSTLWAICGAFGDNLHQAAALLAKRESLSPENMNKLRELGELFNYNGYGATIEDLHFHPEDLYRAIQPYDSPLKFIADSDKLQTLRDGFIEDMVHAKDQVKLDVPGKNRIYSFPDKPWARRVSGVFSNLKAREKTEAAHAIITANHDTTLTISVRAPLNDKRDADTLCKAFPTGGGRSAAAGINNLPAEQLESFIDSFLKIY